MNLQNVFPIARFLNGFSEEKWRRIRSKGKARFIFLRGVIGFGGLMIIVDLLFSGLQPTAHNVAKWLISLFFGFLIGVANWQALEERFPSSNPAISKQIKIG